MLWSARVLSFGSSGELEFGPDDTALSRLLAVPETVTRFDPFGGLADQLEVRATAIVA